MVDAAAEKKGRSWTQFLPMTGRTRRTSKLLGAIMAATLIILSISAYLDLRSSRNLREVAKELFNEQQLVIARHIKWNVERALEVIRRELELATGTGIQKPDDLTGLQTELEKTFHRIVHYGVSSIQLIDRITKKVYVYDYSHRWRIEALGTEAPFQTADAVTKNEFITSPMERAGGIYLVLGRSFADPRYLLSLELELTRFLNPFLRDTRSGKTGYAWVVSQDGTFLNHPFTEFIGENAFTARRKRNPELSHETINFIQEKRMLKGEEGAGSYTTGWHRGITGEIEKLIAYSPILVSKAPPQIWSVAVVAPVSEIDAYIGQTYLWRSLFQAIILIVVAAAATVILLTERQWNRELERKVRERTQSLKTSEEKYRSLVESAEDFIYTVNQEGAFQSINSFTAGFLGGRPEDFVGQSIALVYPGADFEKNRKILNLVYRHGRSVREEFMLQREDQDLWISVNFMPIREASGRVGLVLCIARDVTHEKKLERQLINAEKLASMGTLAAGVAHEINNPLGVILGFTDLLIRKTPPDTQAHADLKTIERQGMHCKQIVENLLRFARFGSGNDRKADINEEIRGIIRIAGHAIEMKKIELVLELAEDIPLVRGDPREWQQVLLNLINNAAAVMKDGGTLTIRSRLDRKKEQAKIQIRDTGHGITREHLDRIYEPFFTTKPEGEGTGLGLAVTYGIISRYGGTIDCDSISTDTARSAGRQRGTVFTVAIPLFREEDPNEWQDTDR
jgi:two-component system, NtrC family, sensor kinase